MGYAGFYSTGFRVEWRIKLKDQMGSGVHVEAYESAAVSLWDIVCSVHGLGCGV